MSIVSPLEMLKTPPLWIHAISPSRRLVLTVMVDPAAWVT
jgi:hypothetical protein